MSEPDADVAANIQAVLDVIDYPHPRMPARVKGAGRAALHRLAARIRELERELDQCKEAFNDRA